MDNDNRWNHIAKLRNLLEDAQCMQDDQEEDEVSTNNNTNQGTSVPSPSKENQEELKKFHPKHEE